jgi:hypothetical protein
LLFIGLRGHIHFRQFCVLFVLAMIESPTFGPLFLLFPLPLGPIPEKNCFFFFCRLGNPSIGLDLQNKWAVILLCIIVLIWQQG